MSRHTSRLKPEDSTCATGSSSARSAANFESAYQSAKARGLNLCNWWKSEVCIGINLPGAAAYSNLNEFTPNIGTGSIDTSFTGSAKPLIGLHLEANDNHLLKRVSNNSILTCSIGENFDLARWNYTVFSGQGLETENSKITLLKLSVPLTIDYKLGCDVDFNPELRYCLTIGAGGAPSAAIALSSDYTSLHVHLAPYVYTTLGFYAHACWKSASHILQVNTRSLVTSSLCRVLRQQRSM